MAPEQRRGGAVGPASDVYALGVVLGELGAGRRRWRRLVHACRDDDPARRPRAGEVAARLDRRRRGLAGAVAALAIAATAALAGSLVPRSAPTARRAVAVVAFERSGSTPDWLATTLAEELRGELGRGGSIRAVAPEVVERVTRDGGPVSPARLGADVVVSGQLAGDERGVSANVRFEDAAGTVVFAAENGEVGAVAAHIAARLRDRLGGPDPSEGARPDSEATRRYAEGMEALRRHRPLAARDALLAAIAAAPEAARAAEEIERAYRLSGAEPREERLLIEAMVKESTGASEAAIDIYRSLVRFFPDDLEYGLRLAQAQAGAGQREAALVTLAALRALPPPLGDDPRIDLGVIAAQKGDPRRRLAAAVDTVRRAEARGADLVAASARVEEGWGRTFTGDAVGARAAFGAARAAAHRLGAATTESDALVGAAVVAWGDGRHADARAALAQALVIRADLGDDEAVVDLLGELAYLEVDFGHPSAALAYADRAIASAESLRYDTGTPHVYRSLAELHLGDLAAARASGARALTTFERLGSADGVTLARLGLAMVATASGDLPGAEATLRALMPAGAADGPKDRVALELLAWVRAQRGDAVEATSLATRARALAGDAPQPSTELLVARLALAAGQEDVAARAATAAVELWAAQGAACPMAWAHAVTACALAATDHDGATRAALRAAELGAGCEQLGLRLRVQIAGAVVAAGGDRTDRARAREWAARALAEAERTGMTELALEARLALGRLSLPDRSRLAAVRADATARGYILVAREAAAALAPR